MLEIEQKFELNSFKEIEQLLSSRKVELEIEEHEVDHYLNAPDRDFAKTGEAFRIRRIGNANYLTYKGPKLNAEVKVRKEIEIPIPEGEQGFQDHLSLFLALSYKFVAKVCKKRRTFDISCEGFIIKLCLDEVETLGCYAEVEIVAKEEDLVTASHLVKKIAQKYGLENVQLKSYLRMVLEKSNG